MGPKNEPIAVIGSGCRFPGESNSPSALWELLKQPRDVLRKIDRFNADSFYHADGHHHGTSNVRESYLLTEDPRAFDPQFFNIQGGEAETIDPQQRLVLESVYEGLESAGLTIESLQGSSTAVYVGVMCDDYADVIYHDSEAIPKYAATGMARSILSNRVSYFFNWCGPSMTIDTACSSSLVAVHQAVQVLRSGESRVAVAAGTNLIFGPKMYIAESNVNMLSATSRSRMWDADANGYARGEGIASVVLKTLSTAIADGDTIECIIRETGINQDGRTTGITMPSATAQANLIRQTYAKAGLDLTKKSDRCQYFEAHGTGTKAGDPQEAGAIYQAFFKDTGVTDPEDILYVGSIKTVIGHTEGTAGIAGLLKASLAIQNKTIPPNMLFNRLNPDLEPFYGHLQVPVEALPWPELPPGTPRRVSVNSFGFGGANAHSIIESYEPTDEIVKANEAKSITAMPFTFSATSERSIAAQLATFLAFLQKTPEIDLRDLAWTLSRRSVFALRASFSALSVETLCSKLEAKLEAKKTSNTAVGTRPLTKGCRILGVFTGQGAQWASMGRELILASPFVESIIDHLEQSLSDLPEADRPSWSLKAEILALPAESRLSEGILSQPVCTAVQVVLVDLLHKAGIDFEAVVGHSSGEIGAAYAAGFISAHDAIRIAYYRGIYTKLARGPEGETGAMLAVGTSMEDASELCQLPTFLGKLQVAASNSSASVTLSGDAEAVAQAKEILEDEGKFARQLKVDTAYHSHHMQPCSGPYVQSLNDCQIQILTPSKSAAKWYSSVLGGQQVDISLSDELSSVYWRDNMLKPVLFSQALEQAIADNGAPTVALEVGPHPALKGPASLTIEDAVGSTVPYAGTLSRGNNDVEAMADSLGFLWNFFGASIVDFTAYDQAFCGEPKASYSFLKNIPSYTWDHEKLYWNESRVSRTLRWRKEPTHELLGVRMGDDVEGEYRWRNFIKPTEMPWLRGHSIQGQTLFPAAGFACMALEASKVLAPIEEVTLIEIHDFSIHRAMAFPDEAAGVETIFSLSNVKEEYSGDRFITAYFACDTCTNKDTGSLVSAANGRLKLRLGEPSLLTLPERPAPVVNMTDVDVDIFYSSLASLGYNYADMFKGITSLKRTTEIASGVILTPTDGEEQSPFTFHPATLDVAFQSIFAAIGSPGDGRLWTLHVPTMIKKIQVNPFACPAGAGLGASLAFDANLSVSVSNGVSGDVDIYDESGRYAAVQVEGLHVAPLSTPQKDDDRQMFAETVWDVAMPDAELGYKDWVLTDIEQEQALFVERTCFFYLKTLQQSITPEEREQCDWHRTKILEWADHIVKTTSEGRHRIIKKEWLDDTLELLKPQMDEMTKTYEDFPNLSFVGDKLIPFIRGQVSLLELFRENNLLDHFYKRTYGFPEYNAYLGRLVKQISHRFQQMEILEVGAGTGSATSAVMEHIGDSYSSYTYTDISAGFFQEAQKIFKGHTSKFIYKALDIEKDITTQGYTAHSYDLIIASNVLHATRSLEVTLSNARKLLKPGGYLVLFEITDTDPLRPGFMFAGMPGWWVGAADNRAYSPMISQKAWDSVLRKSGFSGLDTATPESKVFMVPFSIMATQAVDTQMNLIRQPLLMPTTKPIIENLMILGGQTLPTYKLAEEFSIILAPFCKNITRIEALEDLDASSYAPKQTILSLTELDAPIFNPFTEQKFQAVQMLTEKARNVLWVLEGARGDRPFHNMMIGVARCLVGERQDLRFQCVDMEIGERPNTNFLAETLLRLHISDSWKNAIEPYNPNWTLEREISITKNGMQIPRYKSNPVQNDRYNASKRLVRIEAALESSTVAITSSGSKYELQEYNLPSFLKAASDDGSRTIKVNKSILTAVKVKSIGYLYLVVGLDVKTGKKILAFSESNRSSVSVPESWKIQCDVSDDQEARLLISTASEILASSIIGNPARTTSLLVHESTPLLRRAIKRQAAENTVPVTFTTVKFESAGVCHLHPSIPDRGIESCIPKNVSVFADLSLSTDPDSIGARLEKHIPFNCKRRSASALFSQESSINQGHAEDTIARILEQSYEHAAAGLMSGDSTDEIEELAVEDIPELSSDNEWLRVVNWTSSATAPVRVLPAEYGVQFRNDRTYFMIGMTRELGLSLCQWMINRGAKYIVLTSRDPKVDQDWLDMVQSAGATVKVFAMDVTDKASITAVHKVICDTLPPIAGVANAAMVLIDGLFATMSHEDFNRTLRPKVDGTLYLNEIFQENNLDFFILFSSLAYVTGNIGQTSYAAANAYMASMAEGRRRKGLAGSVMNLAGIFGIGYITRTDRSIIERLGNMGYANISEWDFHQFFAEAVMAGHPDSGRSAEVSSGLRPSDPDRDTNPPAWLSIPRFSYYKRVKTQRSAGSDGKKIISVRSQLKEQTTEEGVYNTLLAGFLATLYHQLHLSPEDNSISPDTSLVELGIDSLVAVDIRYWFNNELDLDLPVLKILGGATVAAMVEDACQRLSAEIIPKIKRGEKPTTETAATEGDKAKPAPEVIIDSNEVGTPKETDTESIEDSDTSESLKRSMPETPESSTEPSSSSASVVMGRKDDVLPVAPKPVFLKTEKMSYGSSQFWFLSQYLEDPTTFNLLFRMSVSGVIQESKLERAIVTLGQRHEAFRTAFFANPEHFNEPTQGVLATSLLRLEKKKIASDKDIIEEAEAMLNYTFDLERGEVIRILLLSLSPSSHVLIFGFHHIAIDGYSFNLLLTELNAIYEGQQLSPVKCQITEFAAKQRREVESGFMAEELKFWKQSLRKLPNPLPLFPMAKVKSRLMLTNYDFEEAEEVILDSKTVSQIEEQCRKNKSTKFHFFLAVFKIFLFRFLDTEDLCIGVADANRTDSNTIDTIGFLLNLLPLRFEADSEQKFADAIKEARTKAYAALSNSRLPFDVLLESLDVPRSSTHSPLFQAFMDYRQLKLTAPKMLGAAVNGVSSVGRNVYDIVLDISENAGSEVRINFRTQKYLYSRTSTEILLKSYVRLVKQFASDSEIQTDKAQLFDPADIQTAMALSRGPVLASDWPVTAAHRIESIALDNPTNIALKDGEGNVLTYSEMSVRVDAVASSLIEAGVVQGSNVAVFQQPTAHWICSLLAIWKVGGVFVPLEPRNTLPRLAIIVKDCQPTAILCHDMTSNDVPALDSKSAKIVNVSAITNVAKGKVILNQANPGSPAMILYTSGSTGVPKGIVLRHSSVLNVAEGYSKKHAFGKEIVLQQSAYSFDLSLGQVLTGLANGGTVYVVPNSKRGDPMELTKLMAAENITYTYATPSEYLSWLRYSSTYLAGASHWKYAFSGGEPMTHTIKNEFRALQLSGLRLINTYGPAETTILCSTTELDYQDAPADSEEAISAGFSLPNYAMYIVNDKLDPVPVGVVGEVVIGGLGSAIGYVNNETLTTDKFILDAYTPSRYFANEQSTVYRSGDLGRLQSDGSLIIEGRIAGDTQIKMRGIRIDLQDIENTIIDAAGGVIYKAVTSVRGNPEFLVTHVEFATTYPTAERAPFLRSLIARLPLPKYMCPAMLIPVDMIPLSNHSKTDRLAVAALPLPQASQNGESDDLSETELALKSIWERVVSKDITETVSIYGSTDFFYVGGNSFLLVKLQALIRERFNVVLPMISLFESSTLRSMASKIETSSSVTMINWRNETTLDDSLVSSQSAHSIETIVSSTASSGIRVLLTGATGFLGRHLLQQLVADGRVSSIHCVAVRQYSDTENRSMSIESAKITTHAGDLAEPLLGMPETKFKELAAEVDVIIHSGANRSLWDYYQVLQGPNFWSTRELTKLALRRKIPVHFISSGGLLQLNPDSTNGEASSLTHFEPPANGSNGYIASKWASEAYLENASKILGLPIHIHRVTAAGENSQPTPALLEEFSELATRMELLPSSSGWDGNFDLISVHALAQQICDSALETQSGGLGQSTPEFVHHPSETQVHMETVIKYLDIHEGKDSYERIAPHEWVGRAKLAGLSYHFASQDFVIGDADGSALLELKR